MRSQPINNMLNRAANRVTPRLLPNLCFGGVKQGCPLRPPSVSSSSTSERGLFARSCAAGVAVAIHAFPPFLNLTSVYCVASIVVFSKKKKRWTKKDVTSLIQPYPKRKADHVLEMLGEHRQLDEDDVAWEDASADEDSQSESMASDSEDGKKGKTRSAVADSDVENVETSADNAVAVDTAVAVDRPALSEAAASGLGESEYLVRSLQQAAEIVREAGCVQVVQQIENEVRKEERRQRIAAAEDPAVAGALRQLKANQASMERQRRLAVDDANRREKELAKVRKDYQQTQELLRKRKKEIIAADGILEEKNAPKRISLEMLGQGKPRSGGALARKHRFEVLDRLAQQGSGLSPAQRNDFSWFKEAWDTKMSEEHQINWGRVFSGWTQKVIDDHSAGIENAFSVFVEKETRRNFKDKVMLVLPAAAIRSCG